MLCLLIMLSCRRHTLCRCTFLVYLRSSLINCEHIYSSLCNMRVLYPFIHVNSLTPECSRGLPAAVQRWKNICACGMTCSYPYPALCMSCFASLAISAVGIPAWSHHYTPGREKVICLNVSGLRKGGTSHKTQNLTYFKFQSSEGLWLYSWCMGTSGLLLHKSHLWSCR